MQTKNEMISKNQIKYIRQLELKKFRKRENCFVAEGPKVVGDLIRKYQPIAIYATEEYFKKSGVSGQVSGIRNQEIVVTAEELRRISFLQTPQQVLALFPIPEPNYQLSIVNYHWPSMAFRIQATSALLSA